MNHILASLQFGFDPVFMYIVAGVVKVIPEFPPQSPEFPVIPAIFQDHAPVPRIS